MTTLPVAAYHGTPITPWATMKMLGDHKHAFCVSAWRPDQVEWVDENSALWFGDNGVFSFWMKARKQGEDAVLLTDDYVRRYHDWCRHWCLEGSGRCQWVVIPDPIGTGTQELDAFIRDWPAELKPFGVPVYHLDEPIDRAVRLLDAHGRLCVGATGEFMEIMSPAFCARMDELFGAILAFFGRVMPIHFFRGLQLLKPECDWPITSADSTDRARNHNRLKHHGEHYLWAFRQSVLRWDRLAASRDLPWPPERLTRHPDLFIGAAA